MSVIIVGGGMTVATLALAISHLTKGQLAVHLVEAVAPHAKNHPELIANKGNIALLQRAQDAGLLAAPIGSAAANAYRTLRRIQHKARLDEQPTQIPQEKIAAEQAAIVALWRVVFSII